MRIAQSATRQPLVVMAKSGSAEDLVAAGVQVFLQGDIFAVAQVPHGSKGLHGPLEQASGTP